MPSKKGKKRTKRARKTTKRAKKATRTATRRLRKAAKRTTGTARKTVKSGMQKVGKRVKETVRRGRKAATSVTKKAKRRAKKTAKRLTRKTTKTRRPRTEKARRRGKKTFPRGIDLLHDERLNKGTAFTQAERDALDLRGLLPPRIHTIAEQQDRVLGNYHHKPTPLEKYIFMIGLQDRNETLFYRTVIDNIHEMMPIIYTPTVGEACAKYGHIFRRSRGLYITANDRGRIAEVLKNWPERDVAIIVVTDGERILGLGDLGADGMGIPIGKLSLYTACAGVHPRHALPITLDVGTNNDDLLADPLYIGLRQRRLRGEAYDEFLEEFIHAVQEVYPRTIVQFEDFATQNAFHLLHRYRDRLCAFNDDIQGTAAVTLAGLLGACRITGQDITQQTLVFLGAGEAGIGIADLIVSAMVREGMDHDEARQRMWFVDSKGLVVASRTDLAEHKLPYAREHEFLPDLLSAVEAAKPTGIVGVSGKPQSFTEPVVRRMGELNDRPIVFALSNPTSKAECTAEQAYTWTDGRGIFASGSPFEPVTINGKRLVPTQGNNAYIFPGLGLGAIVAGAKHITDDMFHAAARAAADMTSDDALAQGSILPPLEEIRELSARIATAVAELAWDEGLASRRRPKDVLAKVRAKMYDPQYEAYV